MLVKRFRALILCAFIGHQLVTVPGAAVRAADFYKPFRLLFGEPADIHHRDRPHTGQDNSIEQLASQIDWLESFIDEWGTIAPKQPDVWGEARLTKHRDEYERIMRDELGAFKQILNASIAQNDSTYLANAFALSWAASGSPPTTQATGATATAAASAGGAQGPAVTAAVPGDVFGELPPLKTADRFVNFENNGQIGLEPAVHLNQLSRYLQHLQELRRINEGDDTSDSPGYSLNMVRIPVSVLPGKKTREGFGAEITVTATPVLSDALLADTMRNLALNDLVDQLGMPVLKAAERKLSDTYSVIVQNHARLEEQLAELHEQLNGMQKQFVDGINEVLPTIAAGTKIKTPFEFQQLSGDQQQKVTKALRDSVANNSVRPRSLAHRPNALFSALPSTDDLKAEDVKTVLQNALNDLAKKTADAAKIAKQIEELERQQKVVEGEILSMDVGGARARRSRLPLASSQIREVLGLNLFGGVEAQFRRAYQGPNIRWSGGGEQDKEQRIHLLDVERYLQQELDAAYELLTGDCYLPLLQHVASENLHRHIADRNAAEIETLRNRFYTALKNKHCNFGMQAAVEEVHVSQRLPKPTQFAVQPVAFQEVPQAATPELAPMPANANQAEKPIEDYLTVTELLAWPVAVELAVLSEHLHEDMVRTAHAKGCGCHPQQRFDYFLPITCLEADSPFQAQYLEASAAFQEYVRCRWPIHVFALDPVDQEQNVADASYRRRELQLALALGFVSGSVSANNLTQFARRLETEIETIALNRTVVGFSHGADTFGWRFMPRVQGLSPPGNLKAFGQTLFGGPSRDHDLAQRQLEPGMRECVAIVLMPSFVPYCDVDVRSNWFKLTNPKNTEISIRDTMLLSRSIKAMQESRALCASCQHLYRDGEVNRLLRRVDQLDRELPLQTLRVQIPFENTLGGFEMFNTGVTDLAPELRGWYGAPGVLIADSSCTANPDEPGCTCKKEGDACKVASNALPLCPGEGTTLFLVGDNFSVHDTRVIAGGVCIPHHRLISRQIVQVTIPPCVNRVIIDGEEYVDIHAATPYGVTGHLHVPIVNKSPAAAEIAALEAKLKKDLERPTFKLVASDKLEFLVTVDQLGRIVNKTEIMEHSKIHNMKLQLNDEHPEFGVGRPNLETITVFGALGQNSVLQMDPEKIDSTPGRDPLPTLDMTTDSLEKALQDNLDTISNNTALTGDKDTLKFDLVVYYQVDATLPRMAQNLGEVILNRQLKKR